MLKKALVRQHVDIIYQESFSTEILLALGKIPHLGHFEPLLHKKHLFDNVHRALMLTYFFTCNAIDMVAFVDVVDPAQSQIGLRTRRKGFMIHKNISAIRTIIIYPEQ